MRYGYKEYAKIIKLLDEFNVVLEPREYERYVAKLVDILKL